MPSPSSRFATNLSIRWGKSAMHTGISIRLWWFETRRKRTGSSLPEVFSKASLTPQYDLMSLKMRLTAPLAKRSVISNLRRGVKKVARGSMIW